MEEKKKKTQTKNKKSTSKSTKKVQESKTSSKKKQTKQIDSKEKTKELTPIIKEAKKTNSNQEKETINFSVNKTNEFSKLVKIVLIIVGVMLVFYAITIVVTQKSEEVNQTTTKETSKEKTEIQYDNIMIGTMLNKDGNYYVLIEADEDNRVTEYESLISTIASSEDAPTIYKANLTDSFNKGYLGKEENYYTSNIKDFKVTGTTLLKIEDGKVVTALDNYDAIKNKLNELE